MKMKSSHFLCLAEQGEEGSEEGVEVDQEDVDGEEPAVEGESSASALSSAEEDADTSVETTVEEREEVLLNPPDFGAEPTSSAFKVGIFLDS